MLQGTEQPLVGSGRNVLQGQVIAEDQDSCLFLRSGRLVTVGPRRLGCVARESDDDRLYFE